MKKAWKKLAKTRKSRRSLSASTCNHPSSDSNPQLGTIADPLCHAVLPTHAVALASSGIHVPSQSQDRLSQQLPPSSYPNLATFPVSDQEDSPSADTASNPPNTPRFMATAYSGTKMVLEVVRETSDVFIPLKSVAGGLSAILKQYDQIIANKNDIKRLITRVSLLSTSLTGPPQHSDAKEIKRREVLEGKLKKVMEILDPMVNQSKVVAILCNADQAAKITSLVEDIRDAMIDYQTSLQQGINETVMELAEISLLEKLPRSRDASHRSGLQKKCLKGTRVLVLERIENWVHDISVLCVYWLSGVAGSGKTTIAQSFAERMYAEGLLGASFFCSRDFVERKNLRFIFPTLAFQLAARYPNFRENLLATLRSDHDVGHGSLESQLKKLLIEPLQLTRLSTVIIIDALDECEDDEPASAILSLLAREIEHIPLVKFFITGRPELRIRSGFRLPTLSQRSNILLLHEVERGDVDEDIRMFLEYHLHQLVERRSDLDLPMPWPSPGDIRIVTSKAAGLFIYAFTVVTFLTSDSHDPRERLRLITMLDNTLYERQLQIDSLYIYLLNNGCSHIHDNDSEYFCRLLLVVGSVALLYQPIPLASLARLLKLKSEDIFTSLRFLHSVLIVPDLDSQPVRVFHKSFPDYLMDNQRCRDPRFFVDSPAHHATLAICCLELMITELKQNVCELPPYAINSEIEDLSTRQQSCIGEALRYACRFWGKHVSSMSVAGDSVVRVIELLNEFIQHHLLRWLEVVSIVNELRDAVHSVVDVERWLFKVKAPCEDLLRSIHEIRRFVLYSYDAIGQSAAHIYHSALVWLPTSSFIRTLYQDQLAVQAQVLNGLDASWDPCIRSISFGDIGMVSSVVFSSSGLLIAGCSGSYVRILEAETGVCIATLTGHNEKACSVAFSSDDVFLASGSKDTTVRVWDVQTGGLAKILEGHTGTVFSVALSPSGTMVASGSKDSTVRIWDISSGNCDQILNGHSSDVNSVCWLGADQLASGGDDHKVKIWDVGSGRCLRTFNEHSEWVWSVASSQDGSKIASGSEDKTIRIRNPRISDSVQTISTGQTVRSVCFSPDGDRIVYATKVSVVVWDLVKDSVIFQWQSGSASVAFSPDGNRIAARTLDGHVKVFQMEAGNHGYDVRDQHSEDVLCIAIAADGQAVVSGSYDKTVKIWNATSGRCMQTFHGHSDWVRSVAISPNSSLIASGCDDTTVRIWDPHIADPAADPCLHVFRGHFGYVRSVAFSHDSSLVASGSDDKTLRIWNLRDPGMVMTLEGHTSCVADVRFSSDDRRIVSASRSLEVILWDVEKFERLAVWTPAAHEEGDPLVSFSADGTRIILEYDDIMRGWDIFPNTKHHAESPEAISVPMVLVPVPLDDVRYRCSEDGEWILGQRGRRVCWIPPDRRAAFSVSFNKTVLLWTRDSRFVRLDFSRMVSD